MIAPLIVLAIGAVLAGYINWPDAHLESILEASAPRFIHCIPGKSRATRMITRRQRPKPAFIAT